jgi:hypothetical protein
MFQYGVLAERLQIEHQHADGTWAPMEPRDPHDAAELDAERAWDRGHVYVCARCQETVRVTIPGEDDGAAGAA